MRILIAAGIFPPDIGGPAIYAERLASHLAKTGHSLRVLCYSSGSNALQFPYPVIRVRRRSFKGITFFMYAVLLIRYAIRSDCIYAQGPVAGGLQALIVRYLLRKPYLVKITGDYAWEQAAARYGLTRDIDSFQGGTTTGLPFRVQVMRFVQKKVARSASCCIVPSAYLQSMVIAWGVPKTRTAVIYNAADISEATFAAKQRASGASDRLVLSVGRLVPWKGFATLIRLWPALLSNQPDAHLVIAGSGPESEKLSALIQRMHLGNRVTLLGSVTQRELRAWYRKSYCFVLNSGYEGFSHAVLEAMAAGLPCSVSRVGGNPELIRHDTNGLLFRYNSEKEIVECLKKLLHNPTIADRLGKNAHETALQFTPERMLSSTTRVLEAFRKKGAL
ncbi:MAG: glycosyltransferase family 4 protein [Candidatus Komeilibacteria bacterium]|nr:glycosyltransferase family 4 protein [Candidatus Komeilibacteria bacterium]